MKVRFRLIHHLLGTASGNPELHREFIASKSKDAEKMAAELESLPAEHLLQKAITVFHRGSDGKPILYDYQIKGFLKEAMGVMVDLATTETKVGKTKLSKFTVKRIVDNFVFVSPRVIELSHDVGKLLTRPIRMETMQGPRVGLITSETVPEGTYFDCEIITLAPSLDEMIVKCLDYGALKGLGQWRNSGCGAFTWEKIA